MLFPSDPQCHGHLDVHWRRRQGRFSRAVEAGRNRARPPTDRAPSGSTRKRAPQNIRAVRSPRATMRAMSDVYAQLLDATIRHLEDLQSRGVRFVPAARETLAELAKPRSARPSPTTARAVAPAPVATPLRPTTPPLAVSPAAPKPAPSPTPTVEMGLSLGLPGDATAGPAQPALSPEARTAAFADLRTRALACVKCPHLVAHGRPWCLAWVRWTPS